MRESINDPQAAISYHRSLLHRFCRRTYCHPYGVFTTSPSHRSPVSAIPTAERRSWPHLLWWSLDDEAMERYRLHVSSDSKSGDVDCAWHLECLSPRCSRSGNRYMSLLLQVNGVIGQPIRNVGYRFSFLQHAKFALRILWKRWLDQSSLFAGTATQARCEQVCPTGEKTTQHKLDRGESAMPRSSSGMAWCLEISQRSGRFANSAVPFCTQIPKICAGDDELSLYMH